MSNASESITKSFLSKIIFLQRRNLLLTLISGKKELKRGNNKINHKNQTKQFLNQEQSQKINRYVNLHRKHLAKYSQLKIKMSSNIESIINSTENPI